MNDKIGNRTYLALKNLYRNSQEIQDEVNKLDFRGRDGDLAYAKEFATIKLCGPRRSGHSEAIAKFIKEYYQGNWAIITVTLHNTELIREKIRYQLLKPTTKPNKNPIATKLTQAAITIKDGKDEGIIHLMSMYNFDNALRGLNLTGIIVDCASLLSKSKVEELYQVGMPCMKNHRYQFFIFVE